MRNRFVRLLAAALLVLTGAGTASAATAAQAASAASPTSRVCKAGACLSVAKPGPSSIFTATLTCTTAQTVIAGVRAYFPDGNYSTSSGKRVSCTPGTTTTLRFGYLGSGSFVGFRAALGLRVLPTLGPYVGAPVPTGGHEAYRPPVIGFSWD